MTDPLSPHPYGPLTLADALALEASRYLAAHEARRECESLRARLRIDRYTGTVIRPRPLRYSERNER